MFDFFFGKTHKPQIKYPAYLGYTVHQSEYDTLMAENRRLQKRIIELKREHAAVGDELQVKTECDRERKSAQDWYAKYMEENQEVSNLARLLTQAHETAAETSRNNDELIARLKKRDELITKLAGDLQEANDTIERQAIEIDVLRKAAAKRKPKPRETEVRP